LAGFSDEELVSGCEDSWKKDWVRLVGFSDEELSQVAVGFLEEGLGQVGRILR
jgi:hypothetical protein